MKNKYPYNKPSYSCDTYIDKLISLKKTMKNAKEMQEEAKETMLKMSIKSMYENKRR